MAQIPKNFKSLLAAFYSSTYIPSFFMHIEVASLKFKKYFISMVRKMEVCNNTVSAERKSTQIKASGKRSL
jgi:hypothetical protein